MVRRVRSRTRKYAGDRTFGGGNKKNRRGKGSRGGRGRAGYHKHKWMHTIKYEFHELMMKHKGFHNVTSRKIKTITLEEINKLVERGKMDKNQKSEKNERLLTELSLPNQKVLATGFLLHPVKITASAFSAGAKQKIEKAGGSAIVMVNSSHLVNSKSSQSNVGQ